VRFLGRLDPAALEPYYRHAIALIVPSVCYETFGIIVLEAFRHGTPVIARRLGPLEEIVEGAGGGELFQTSDELVRAMRALQGDPDRRRALGHAASLAFHQHYSDTVVVPRFLDLAAQAIDRRRQRARDARG
jgi:glycosyltransferase involved in cell wall biosynthesis